MSPAPGYYLTCGPHWNSGSDGYACMLTHPDDGSIVPVCSNGMRGGQIRIHPDDSDSDAEWVATARHEIGHSWCYGRADYSEACAAAYE